MAKATNPYETTEFKQPDVGLKYGIYNSEEEAVFHKIQDIKSSGIPAVDMWLEVSDELLHKKFRSGLGDAGYAIWDGVKLCPFGMKEKLIEKSKENLEDRLHG